MLMRVVPVPFDHRPVKLLPPRARYSESTGRCATQRRNRRRLIKVALQILIGSQLLNRHSRITTVKSRPGSDPVAVGTLTMCRLTCASATSGANPNPSTTFDIVDPDAIESVQYNVVPCSNCNSIGAESSGSYGA